MNSRPIIRSALVLPCILALAAGKLMAQVPVRVGEPIVDYIEDLRDQGIRIIYSDELLPARLRVAAAAAPDIAGSTDPVAVLREVLKPHGLDIEPGPRSTWLVVRQLPEESAPGSESGNLARLSLVPPTLDTIVVTASRYTISRPNVVSASSINRHTLENSPALGQDPLRVTQTLPGVTASELSSQSHIRGGELNEALLRLDGIRLYSPYHLKDFQNIFSSIDSRIVGSMDIRTGGYEARFGDRMSGVIDMRSIDPAEPRHHELAVSLLDASVFSSGIFGRGRGAWVTSVRRGNLDVLADAVDSDIGQPQYVDFFSKLSYSLNSHWTLTGSALSLDDKIGLNDGDDAKAGADYDDSYLWLTLEHSSGAGLESSLRIISTRLERTRIGDISDPERVTGYLDEQSRFDRTDVNADFALPLSDRQYLAWGFELADLSLDHSVESAHSDAVSIQADDLAGHANPPADASILLDQLKRAFYISYRLRWLPRVITEIGVRWDNQSITDEDQQSPRLNLRYDLSDRTRFRAAWGKFAQSHSPTELAVSDGETELLPAEKSEHLILGLEHTLASGLTLRAEAYSKRVSRLNPRYENLFERVSLIPELLPDRFRISPRTAEIQGIELSIEGGHPDRFNWWANLARSEAQERLGNGRVDRSWDERWSIKAGGEWTRQDWTLTASTVLRSGWPITDLLLFDDQLVAGPFNTGRLADYTSLNVRANRRVATASGELNWFIEVSNLLDRANYCCVDYRYTPATGSEPATLASRSDTLFGIVPNIGMRWQF